MNLDAFLAIVGIVFLVVCYVGCRWGSENVYIRPKKYRIERFMKRQNQKVGGKKR